MATTNLDALSLSTGIATASIADNAVTTAKLADVNVTTGKLADNAITTAKLAATLQTNQRSHVMPTIATTGTTEVIFRAPVTGTVTAASFIGKDALAQATALVTFTVVNKGQVNAGTTAVLAAVDANSTKTSTGAPIVAYTPFPLTLHGTPANLAVVKGDVLTFTVTVSGGTLANTVTEGLAVLEFTPS